MKHNFLHKVFWRLSATNLQNVNVQSAAAFPAYMCLYLTLGGRTLPETLTQIQNLVD